MRAFDLVMFDLDGTLVATAPEIMDAVTDTLHGFGLRGVTQQQVNNWIGMGTHELLALALASASGLDLASVRGSDLLAQVVMAYNAAYQRRCGTSSQLYPRVRETLLALRNEGVKLAVVTNKEACYTRVVLNAHQITDLFDLVISGDTLPTKKPNPAGVVHCLAELDVPAARALFVGDSSIDVATARNAGVAVWVLPYGYNMGQVIEDSAPDRVIPDCSLLLH